MKTKTWKIGECCKGGIITVEIRKGTVVSIIGKEWDFSKGYSKTSNQSMAREFTRLTVDVNAWGSRSDMDNFLNDLTSSYYADQVLSWIEANAEVDKTKSW
jgi:hypothetical protein